MFVRVGSSDFSESRRAAFFIIYTILKYLSVFLSAFTSRHKPNLETSIGITTPAMSAEKYLSLFETENAAISANVSRLLTDFGVASQPRPALEIVYDELLFTTNSTFDNMKVQHDRKKQSLCYVVLMAGLDPDMTTDVIYVWDRFISNASLVHFNNCTLSVPPASSYSDAFYDKFLEAWFYDLPLFVLFSGASLMYSDEESFFFSFLFYFWIFNCAGALYCFVSPLLAYTGYLEARKQFLAGQVDYLRASNLLPAWKFKVVSRPDFGAWAVAVPVLVPVVLSTLYTAVLLLFPFFWVSEFPSVEVELPQFFTRLHEKASFLQRRRQKQHDVEEADIELGSELLDDPKDDEDSDSERYSREDGPPEYSDSSSDPLLPSTKDS